MIRITTRKDVDAQLAGLRPWGYTEPEYFSDLCDAVWDALGNSLGKAVRIAPSGAVSHYNVEREELEIFCEVFATSGPGAFEALVLQTALERLDEDFGE